MSEPKTISDEKPAEAQTPSAETAVAAGRARYESAMDKQDAGTKCAELLQAVRQFQNAIQVAPDAPEAYGWLAQTYRMLASATRPTDAERADLLTRFACAIAWEGTLRSTPTSIPIRTKQEVRTLTAWLRTTRHLSLADAEQEMKALHEQSLETALSF
jgi:hypothetical protein